MNRNYRVVWNESTRTHVAAAETSMARGKRTGGVVTAGGARALSSHLVRAPRTRLIASVIALALGGIGFALPSVSFAGAVCINDASGLDNYGGNGATTGPCSLSPSASQFPDMDASDYAVIGNSGGSKGAAMMFSNASADMLLGTGNVLRFSKDGSTNNVRLSGVAAGLSATDAVNYAQLSPLVTALGAGASIDAVTGAVTAPAFTLGNANTITGASGTYGTVGGALTQIDSALGVLNSWKASVAGGAGVKYFHTNSSLADSSATGANATAIGPAAVASSASAVAIGNGATAYSGGFIATASLALGPGASASSVSGMSGDGSIAIGANAQANMSSSGGSGGNGGNIAIGINASATGSGGWGNNTAIGKSATTTGYDGVALGSNATAAYQSTALGRLTVASGNNTVAAGWGANAAGLAATALGNNANASAGNSVALGASSTTTADLTKAGYNPGSSTLSGTASTANGEVSMGSANKERRLTNVAAGASATDAVNVSQLQSEAVTVSNNGTTTAAALGGGASYNATTGTLTAPNYALGNANSIAGSSGAATDVGTGFAKVDTALGNLNTATTNNTASISNLDARVSTNESNIATLNTNLSDVDARVTQNTTDIAGNTTSISNLDARVSTNESNIATLNTNLSDVDARVTQNTTDIASNTASISTLQTTINNINNGVTGLVQQSAAGADLTVGANTDGAAVDLADKNGKTRTLKSVTAGVNDTDAVNMSQLNATNAAVAQNTSNIAANTTSITNLDARVATSENDIRSLQTDITSISGAMSDAVAYDSSAHDSVTLGGAIAAGPVTLHNVAAGALTASSTDAVNGSQLYTTNTQVANLDSRVTQNATDIANLSTMINSNGQGGLVQQDAVTRTITVAKATDGAVVDFTGTAGSRVLTGVSAGAVNASSADAVNGSQLNAVAISTAAALGGGSSVNTDGTITAPAYAIGGKTFANAGSALTNMDNRVSYLETQVINATGAVANAVQYDSGARDTVTLGGATASATVKLSNLTQGQLSASSTDAVTGAQLYATNLNVTNLQNSIQNLSTTGSTTISSNTTSGASSASGTNSTAMGGGASASGANSTAMGDKAAASGDNSVAIGANSVADQDNTVSVGSQGSERRITNVADGVAPTDAVNMRQFQSGMGALQRNAYGGVAAATALTMIPDVDSGKTIAVGVGTANYHGYQATALGASARIAQNLKLKVGGGYSAGGATVGGGVSYQW